MFCNWGKSTSGGPAQLLLFGECAPEVPSELPAAARCRGSVPFVLQDMSVFYLLTLCLFFLLWEDKLQFRD